MALKSLSTIGRLMKSYQCNMWIDFLDICGIIIAENKDYLYNVKESSCMQALHIQPIPKIYQKNNRDCYLDPVRKRLTYVTPEETVRQQIISYLITELSVPIEMIKSEEPLSHYGINSKNRADIVIHKIENDALMPLAVIECKAPNVYLGKNETDQVVGYANDLYCDYILLSNGFDSFSYHFSENENSYLSIEELPSYIEMLGGESQYKKLEEIPERIPFNKLKDYIPEDREIGYSTDIGANTPMDTAVMALNLWECLLDYRDTLPVKQYGIFTLIEDLGVRLLSYGNASGGVFSGPYRSYLIEFQGENQIVSFGLSTYCTYAHQDVEKTSLNIAIDTDVSAHHALQFVIDDNVIQNGTEFEFYHHGRIAVGNIGSGKVSELRSLVLEYYPKIIRDNKFYFGAINNTELFTWGNSDVSELIENLISYALIRDMYRAKVKNQYE